MPLTVDFREAAKADDKAFQHLGRGTTDFLVAQMLERSALSPATRVARSVRGKYADVPASSEDFIRQKREEVKLEERLL